MIGRYFGSSLKPGNGLMFEMSVKVCLSLPSLLAPRATPSPQD